MTLAAFRNYQLPTLVQLQAAVGPITGLDANSFSEAVRNFHLDRLPTFSVNTTGATCVYCGKIKDRRALQIDHIIPIRAYVRARLYQGARRFRAGGRITIAEGRRIYQEHRNLVLACQKCNSAKSDRMPDTVIAFRAAPQTGYAAAMAHSAALPVANRIEESRQFMQWMRGIRNPEARDYIFGNLLVVAHRMNLRGAADHGDIADRVRRHRIRSARYEPYQRPRQTNREEIEHVVTSLFARGRPDIDASFDDLEAAQAHAPGVHNVKHRRVCYCCLGVFNKQSFQLDHIRPIGRGFGNFAQTPANIRRYNDPTNILPICRTCNGSKGNGTITRGFLDGAIQRRQDEDLPGIEDVLSHVDYTSAQLHQRAFFGV